MSHSNGAETVKRPGGCAAHLWVTGGDGLLVSGARRDQVSLLDEQVPEEDHGYWR